MRMSEKCRNNKHSNNNADNPLTSRRTDGVTDQKNVPKRRIFPPFERTRMELIPTLHQVLGQNTHYSLEKKNIQSHIF